MDRRSFLCALGAWALLGSSLRRADAGGLTDHIFADRFELDSGDPGNLSYLGAFRVPNGGFGGIPGDNFYYCSDPVIGIGSGPDRLFMVGSDLGDTMEIRTVAELSIPELVPGNDLSALNVAGVTQNFANLLENLPHQPPNWTSNRVISGLYSDPVSNRLAVNVTRYYDTQTPPNPYTTIVVNQANEIGDGIGKRGYFRMTGGARSSGWISPIPPEFQGPEALGGTHIFGNSDGFSINGRASIGPSAFVYDLDRITGDDPPIDGAEIDAMPVIDFPFSNPMAPIEDLEQPGHIWTVLSRAMYGFIVPGTGTYLAIGHSAGHKGGCGYGVPPWNPSGNSGFHPLLQHDVGNHYWAFRVDDMIAARHGLIEPHDIRPFAHGDWVLPWQGVRLAGQLRRVSGACMDPLRRRLYVSLRYGDSNGCEDGGSCVPLPLVLGFALP